MAVACGPQDAHENLRRDLVGRDGHEALRWSLVSLLRA